MRKTGTTTQDGSALAARMRGSVSGSGDRVQSGKDGWNAVLCLVTKRETKTIAIPGWAMAASALTAIAMVVSLSATSLYIAFQDDLLAASIARNSQMQMAYEDRIASLRTQVDLVTSRQLLDQQAIETRVSELARRQARLGTQHNQVQRAISGDTLSTGSVAPSHPVTKPTLRKLKFGSLIGSDNPFGGQKQQMASLSFAELGSTTQVIETLEASMERTEREQLARLRKMQEEARQKSKRLASILRKQGIRVPNETAIGGPLIEVDATNRFSSSVSALESSLETLEKVRRAAYSLPHGSPTPGQQISSRFGTRRDPFTGRRAMHGGLDFRAPRGTSVLATASGKVVRAGRMGGYGKLVEIDHGGGITTRYAHLSRINVRKGQRIKRGRVIGKVGSTGRSTGPHLHYEVRRKRQVLDPIHYVKLEKKLRPYL
ncbi:MAG: M23 family metallopeptidase [Ahrensia sp.]|nr:M23 family metallopeptidase [Ahrensia sp.]